MNGVCKGEEKIQIISCSCKENYNSCIANKNKMCVSSRRSVGCSVRIGRTTETQNELLSDPGGGWKQYSQLYKCSDPAPFTRRKEGKKLKLDELGPVKKA